MEELESYLTPIFFNFYAILCIIGMHLLEIILIKTSKTIIKSVCFIIFHLILLINIPFLISSSGASLLSYNIDANLFLSPSFFGIIAAILIYVYTIYYKVSFLKTTYKKISHETWIYRYLYGIKKYKKFAKKTLLCSFLFDNIIFISIALTLNPATDIFEFIITLLGISLFLVVVTGAGTFLSYLSFYLWIPTNKGSNSLKWTTHLKKQNAGVIIPKIFTVLFLIQWMFLAYSLKYSGKDGYLFCLIILVLSFIPLIAAIVLRKIAQNRTFKIILLTILFIYSFILESITVIGTYLCNTTRYIPQFAYEKELKLLKKRLGPEPLSHFPKEIPQKAKNFQLKIEDAWDESEYTISFKIDKAYRDQVIHDFYECCTVYIDKNHPHEHIPLHAMEAKDSDQFCYFTLKAVDNYYYYSGIAINNETDTIYYFYNK